MKKIVFVLFNTLISFLVYAQTTCDEKGIVTNPVSPVNLEKSSAANFISWELPAASPNFTCYPNGYPSYPILSPWHTADPNFNYIDLANGTNSDYEYADGWELLKANLGKFNDNTTSRQRTVKIPYIILYNKHQGLIRMFASLRNPDYTYKTVVVKFSHPKGALVSGQASLNASSLLSLGGETAQALDQQTEVTSIRMPTYFPNNENYFFWIDLPVAYDPCVCKYQGQVDVNFEFYSQADINMEGIINGTWQTITQTDPSNGVLTVAKTVAPAIVSIAVGASTGVWNFGSIVNLLSLFELKGNLSQSQKDAISFFKLTGKLADGIYEYDKTWEKASTSNDPKAQAEAFKKLLTSYSDFTTGAMGIGLGAGSPKSVNTITALAKLQGTWTKVDEYGGGAFSFSTPGSKDGENNLEENINNTRDANNNILPEYPTYNEILGTFALLKKPTVRAHDSVYSIMVTDPVWGTLPEAHLKRTLWLDEDLEYAFNPIANVDMSKTVIKVAFEIVNTIQLPPGSSSNIHAMDELTNLEPTANTVRYMSPLVPISCFKELVSRYHASIRGDLVSDLQKVRLKFYIELVSTDLGSNGINNRATHVFTYPVNISQTITPGTANPKPMGSYQVLNGTGAGGIVTLSGTINFPANKIVFATDKIVITSGTTLTGDPNNPAKLIARNLIEVQSNVNIGPGVDLIISALPMVCNNPMDPKTHTYVKQFCSNQISGMTYRGNQHAAKSEDVIDSLWNLKKAENKAKNNLAYFSEVYPNPTAKTTILELLSPSIQSAEITITNVTGQVIKLIPVQLSMYGNKIDIDLEGVSSGVYYIAVTTENNTIYETNRLVLLK